MSMRRKTLWTRAQAMSIGQRLQGMRFWPSILPLVDRISGKVRLSLDRLESLRLFCANTMLSCSIFIFLICGLAVYEFISIGQVANVGAMIALTALLVIVGVLLHKQGSNYQHLEVTTLQHYLRREIAAMDDLRESPE